MLNKFEPVSAEDITLIIKSMVSKSCELDVIPTTLLKDILPHIIDTLVKIINASLEQGVFCRKVESNHSKTTTEETGPWVNIK